MFDLLTNLGTSYEYHELIIIIKFICNIIKGPGTKLDNEAVFCLILVLFLPVFLESVLLK